MTLPSIVHSNTSVELKSAPINPDWILEGNPVARNAELSRSRDGTACTLVWDCTPGKFVWHYHMDETIHVLEGSIVLDDGTGPARRLGPRDGGFLPAGAKVRWHVESHVRKLAFFRRVLPKPVQLVTRAMRKAKKLVRPSSDTATGWMGTPGNAPTSVSVNTVLAQS